MGVIVDAHLFESNGPVGSEACYTDRTRDQGGSLVVPPRPPRHTQTACIHAYFSPFLLSVVLIFSPSTWRPKRHTLTHTAHILVHTHTDTPAQTGRRHQSYDARAQRTHSDPPPPTCQHRHAAVISSTHTAVHQSVSIGSADTGNPPAS